MCQHLKAHAAIRVALLAISLLTSVSNAADEVDDPLSAEATAPANMKSLGSTLGGSFFVDEKLVEQSDSLKNELRELKSKILAGEVSATQATNQLDVLETQLAATRKQIEDQKVVVSAFNVYTKREESVIPINDCELLILQGDAVKLRGWAGPGIKCVVEKNIVAKTQPDDSEFDAIRVKHKLGPQNEIVGVTPEEVEQGERDYANAHPELTPQQLATHKEFVDSIAASNAKYAPFQGHDSHFIELEGLKEGNENISIKIASAGGTTTHSSQRKRHATLTVFLPVMKQVCVRGCQAKLDIQDIQTNLVLTTSGSRHRDYEGSFVVKNVEGNVTIDQAPVRELTDIRGNVEFVATNEFVNGGTHHGGGLRTTSSYATAKTTIRNIDGYLTLRILRTKLFVSQVSGKLDILNDVGDTVLDAAFSASPALEHRIVSECGKIEIRGPLEKLKDARIHAYTRCGRLHTNLRQDVLDTSNFSSGSPQISWRGLVPPSKEQFDFARFDRPMDALANNERKAGIDLISKAGEIQIIAE